jgi:shikimate kinase
MMLDPGNAEALSRTGHVFCLAAAPEDILERITRDTATPRPLLAVANPMERIRSLLRQRQHGYRRFRQVVTSGTSPEAVVDILIAMLKR